MVLADGRVKVMDFGIARLREPTVKTQTGVLLGSPQYMSPEQISGNEVDGRADIFSLGVVLYEMLTGVKPFDAVDLSQVLFWVVNMPAKPPSERRPGLPPVVDYIIARALKKKPEERYASAAEFAADLRRCLPEVREAEGAIRASAASGDTTPHDASTLPMADERLELRPSRQFEHAAALARLSVVPHDDASASRGGWTVPVAKARRRVDRASAFLAATYGIAVLLAVAIVVL
jgi:serine/threonine-protein kinase